MEAGIRTIWLRIVIYLLLHVRPPVAQTQSATVTSCLMAGVGRRVVNWETNCWLRLRRDPMDAP